MRLFSIPFVIIDWMIPIQLGKVVGIAISGVIMTTAGYAGIFGGAAVVWVILLGFAIAYHFILKK